MKRSISVLILACMLLTLFCGCGVIVEQPDDTNEGKSTEGNKTHTEEPTQKETEAPTEPEPTTQGSYTIEDCENRRGIYLAYEDGSFDRYPSGGYCDGLHEWYSGFYGMFLEDSVADRISSLDQDAQVVVFWDEDFSVALHPIHATVSVIQMTSEEGVLGYGKLNQLNQNGVAFISVHYENHDTQNMKIQYIDGDYAGNYSAIKYYEEVNPYKGMSGETVAFQHFSFQPGTAVTLGVGEGTKLVETSYDVDTIYYDCDPEHNHYSEEDIYGLQLMPTAEGYAVLDFSDIPAGRYIMVLRSNGKYIATLVDV